jgi:hypothetical protein
MLTFFIPLTISKSVLYSTNHGNFLEPVYFEILLDSKLFSYITARITKRFRPKFSKALVLVISKFYKNQTQQVKNIRKIPRSSLNLGPHYSHFFYWPIQLNQKLNAFIKLRFYIDSYINAITTLRTSYTHTNIYRIIVNMHCRKISKETCFILKISFVDNLHTWFLL